MMVYHPEQTWKTFFKNFKHIKNIPYIFYFLLQTCSFQTCWYAIEDSIDFHFFWQ